VGEARAESVAGLEKSRKALRTCWLKRGCAGRLKPGFHTSKRLEFPILGGAGFAELVKGAGLNQGFRFFCGVSHSTKRWNP